MSHYFLENNSVEIYQEIFLYQFYEIQKYCFFQNILTCSTCQSISTFKYFLPRFRSYVVEALYIYAYKAPKCMSFFKTRYTMKLHNFYYKKFKHLVAYCVSHLLLKVKVFFWDSSVSAGIPLSLSSLPAGAAFSIDFRLVQ